MKIRFLVSFSVLFILVSLFVVSTVYAQAPPFQDDEIPVDGGISLLIAAGALIGLRSLKSKK